MDYLLPCVTYVLPVMDGVLPCVTCVLPGMDGLLPYVTCVLPGMDYLLLYVTYVLPEMDVPFCGMIGLWPVVTHQPPLVNALKSPFGRLKGTGYYYVRYIECIIN